jgi:DNA-binding transcriptional ArsR family regulator
MSLPIPPANSFPNPARAKDISSIPLQAAIGKHSPDKQIKLRKYSYFNFIAILQTLHNDFPLTKHIFYRKIVSINTKTILQTKRSKKMNNTTPTNSEELINFFKALSEPNRLRIIGLLAQEPRTVEQIAAMLNLKSSTISGHLSVLANAHLVSARPDGHYYIYSLETKTLQEMARRLLNQEHLAQLSEDVDTDAYDQKVLANFVNEQGRIKSFPSQEKKFLVILRYVLKAFEPGMRYSEKQVNEILSRFHEDSAQLRRSLITYGYMARASDGTAYWRVDGNQ